MAAILYPIGEVLAERSIPEPNSGCWLWFGALDPCGYGVATRNKKQFKVHRLSFEHFVGPIPDGLNVLHSCDMPCCINPDHLRAGTHQDNMADRTRRGRGSDNRGEKNPKAKVGEADVRVIRQRHANGENFVTIARDYALGENSISNICRRKTWAGVLP